MPLGVQREMNKLRLLSHISVHYRRLFEKDSQAVHIAVMSPTHTMHTTHELSSRTIDYLLSSEMHAHTCARANECTRQRRRCAHKHTKHRAKLANALEREGTHALAGTLAHCEADAPLRPRRGEVLLCRRRGPRAGDDARGEQRARPGAASALQRRFGAAAANGRGGGGGGGRTSASAADALACV